ncbi:SsgA family sporulation/cell division regulator [Nocardioides sp. Iso805N]|uniref:SsgA family sporulation/cell division regulator n=1 Tax=Nocardioides sp. Iso805N TaxID=1283287 RepID=UPI0003A55E65|nr:SsgA family sporulation/cell division regulator [Nocardioides sp. Iso805N]
MTQQPTTPVLFQDITLACVDPWGRNVDVPTTLGFCSHDPYAVTMTFHSSAGDVDWVLARTLLLRGLAAPAGEGDVKVYPSIDDDARAVAVLDFSSPDGRLVAQASTHELQTFLSRTFAAVPIGTESDHLDLDSLIADLLRSVE